MTEPVYLWNWSRTRRHIDSGTGFGYGLCGAEGHERRFIADSVLRGFSPIATRRRQLAKLDEVPVCKHCLRQQAAS